ncbi:hypothetical protein [Tissierella praeacuta]|uniref:hypothetical protein n=1 Tax=Tissierella praeacuta TaxID=43131 RepID=UPI003340CFA5
MNEKDIQDYIKTDWQPNIVDPLTNEVISEGTRFTSKRANNIEDGIFTNRELHKIVNDRLKKMQIELEIIGRVPGGNSFFDSLSDLEDDIKGMLIDEAMTFATNIVDSVNIQVKSIKRFKIGEYIIYDDENIEVIKVAAVRENELVVSSLTKNYKKGAIIAKSNAKINEGFQFGYWGNYSVKGEVV